MLARKYYNLYGIGFIMRFKISDTVGCLRFTFEPLGVKPMSNDTTIWYDYDIKMRPFVTFAEFIFRGNFRCLKINHTKFLLYILESVQDEI